MGEQEPIRISQSDSGDWVGEHHSDLVDLNYLFTSLVSKTIVEPIENEEWRAILPKGYTFIRALGARTIHLRVAHAEIQDLVLKYAPPNPRRGLRRITDQVRHSRAQRRYQWGHRLRALGINTARPLGFIEHSETPAFDDSFVVTEYIYAPTLLEFRDDKIVAVLRAHQNAAFEKRASAPLG